MDPDVLLRPWLDALAAELGGPLALYDAHTHVGTDDPDGYKQTPTELLTRLERAGARAAVFPMHEPQGYPAANDAALAAAARDPARLVAFCRVDPHADAVGEATRMLDAGARGIKLHPRAERFTLDAPAVHALAGLAHERRVPRLFIRADPSEPLALARLACAVGEETEHSALCAQVLELLDLYERHLAPPPDGRPLPLSGRCLLAALALARTPDVALPPRPTAPAPVRA